MARYDLVAFDLDGTLATGLVYVWQRLHEGLATDPGARSAARQAYFAGRLDYAGWFGTDVELLQARGATRARLLETLRGVQATPGATDVLGTLRAAGHRLAVISGSVDLLVERLFPAGTFDHVLINRLHFDAAGVLSGGQATPFDMEGKAVGLQELATAEGIDLSRCVFVGDNDNDVAALRAAGLGVAFEPKSERVRAAADHVLEGPSLTPLLPLLLGR